MSGKAPRQKGDRLERLAVDILQSYGLDAYRIPLSGAMRGFKGDIEVRINNDKLAIEAKSRKAGHTFIYDSLGDNDGLLLKVDRREPLMIMSLRRFSRLLAGNEAVKLSQSKPKFDKQVASLTRAYQLALDQSLGKFSGIVVSGLADDGNAIAGGGSSNPSPHDVSRET